MNKAVPWSIKGVDFDARTAAKEAARRAGMTLGEWLNSVIAEQAAEMGVEPEDVGEDDRLDAISSRLQRMRRRTDRPMAGPLAGRRDAHFEPDDFDEPPRAWRERRSFERDYDRMSSRRWRDSDEFLDEAVARFERSSRRGNAHTSAALDQLDRRLSGIENHFETRQPAQPDRTLQRALSRLETRIEALAARDERPAANPSESLDARLAGIAARLKASSQPQEELQAGMSGAANSAPVPPAAVQPASAMRSSDLARIEAKLNMLLDRGPDAAGAAVAPTSVHEAYAPRRSLAASIAEINRRQADLDGGAPAPRAPRTTMPAAPPVPPAAQAAGASLVSALKNEIENLSARVEGMRSELRQELREQAARTAEAPRQRESASAHASPAAADANHAQRLAMETKLAGGISGLQEQVSAMSAQLAQLAPRQALESLQRSVGELSVQMGALRNNGVQETIVRPVEELVGEVRRSLSQFEPGASYAHIERELQAINRKIGSIGAQGAVTVQSIDPDDFARVQQQTSEIRNLLAAAAARPLAIDKIEQQIGALSKRVELIAARGPSVQGAQAVSQSVDEIRFALDQALPASAFDKIETRIEELSRRFDDFTNSAGAGQLAAVSDRIEALQKAMAWQNERLPALRSENGALEDMMRSVIARIDAAPAALAAAPGNAGALEKSVRELAEKLESASARPEGLALSAIEDQVRDISARLEGVKGAAQALNGIETTLGEVFSRLEENRLAAIDAAESAARMAVRETIAGTAGMNAGETASAARSLVEKEMSSLRALQDAADRRTHSTLSAVHETLEKIVDRLAVLEGEDEPRAMPAKASAPYQPPSPSSSQSSSYAPPPVAPAASPAPPAAAPAPAVAPSVAPPMPAAGQTLASGPAPVFSKPVAMDVPPVAGLPPSQEAAAALRVPPPAAAPQVAPQVALENDELLEPGVGYPAERAPSAAPSIFANAAPAMPPASAGQPQRFNQNDADARAEAGNASSSFIAAARRAQQAAQAQAEREAPAKPQTKSLLSGLMPGDALNEAQSRARAAATALSGSLGRKGKAAPQSAGAEDDDARAAREPVPKSAGRFGKVGGLLTNRKVLLGLASLVIVGGSVNILMQKIRAPKPASGVTAPAGKLPPGPPPAAPRQQQSNAASPLSANDGREAGQFTPQAGPSRAGPSLAGQSLAAPPPAAVQPQPAQARPAAQSPAAPAQTDRAPVSTIRPDLEPAPARNNLHAAAASGDPAAQFELGVRYIDGNGMTRNGQMGVGLLEKAAGQGLAPAQYRLGSIFEKGLAGRKDIEAARRWYSQAADAGNIRAMHNLGVLIAEGADGKPDYASASRWFRAAAEHGVRDSQYNLAILHARGMGVPQNLIDSYMWFSLAAAQGDTDAAAKRDDVGKRLSANQLAVAKARAESFRTKTANAAANDVPAPAGGWQLDAPAAEAPAPASAPARPARTKKPQRVSAR